MTKKEIKQLAYSRLLFPCDFIFNGKYTNREITIFLEEKARLESL